MSRLAGEQLDMQAKAKAKGKVDVLSLATSGKHIKGMRSKGLAADELAELAGAFSISFAAPNDCVVGPLVNAKYRCSLHLG